jgi:hypothetical protein
MTFQDVDRIFERLIKMRDAFWTTGSTEGIHCLCCNQLLPLDVDPNDARAPVIGRLAPEDVLSERWNHENAFTFCKPCAAQSAMCKLVHLEILALLGKRLTMLQLMYAAIGKPNSFLDGPARPLLEEVFVESAAEILKSVDWRSWVPEKPCDRIRKRIVALVTPILRGDFIWSSRAIAVGLDIDSQWKEQPDDDNWDFPG